MRDFAAQRRPNSSGVGDGNCLNRQSERRDEWTGIIGDNKCSSVCVCVCSFKVGCQAEMGSFRRFEVGR